MPVDVAISSVKLLQHTPTTNCNIADHNKTVGQKNTRTGLVYDFSVFFFSSRRRHTRFDCDWSSDVCSSDLYFNKHAKDLTLEEAAMLAGMLKSGVEYSPILHSDRAMARRNLVINNMLEEIGRASCRERV